MSIKQILMINQNQFQSQRTSISPQLRYSNNILQLSTLELVNKIQEELQENPFLEEDISYIKRNTIKSYNIEIDRKSYLENIKCKNSSLYDFLYKQLLLIDFNSQDQLQDCQILISFINERGYLSERLDKLSKNLDISEYRLNKALKIIQTLEPQGIGARNLNECMLLQLQNNSKIDFFIRKILIEKGISFFKSFSRKEKYKYEKSTSLSFIEQVWKRFRSLEPIPARPYFSHVEDYIFPDIEIKRDGDKFNIILFENMPKIKFNQSYIKVFNKKDDYIKEKLFEAKNIFYSIKKRRESILHIAKLLVKIQKDFFLKGVLFLKPLRLIDIANDMNIHESTVSRIINKKYILSNWGIFSLKYFFSGAVIKKKNLNKNEKSVQSIKEYIKQVILKNGNKKALSDQKIKEILETKKIFIARRTVSKYRKQLNILPSFLRDR